MKIETEFPSERANRCSQCFLFDSRRDSYPRSHSSADMTVILSNAPELQLECSLPALGITLPSLCQKLPEESLLCPPPPPSTHQPPQINQRPWLMTLHLLPSRVRRCPKTLGFCHGIVMVRKVGLLDQLHQHCLETCHKCKFLGLSPDLVNQKLMSPPGDSHTC